MTTARRSLLWRCRDRVDGPRMAAVIGQTYGAAGKQSRLHDEALEFTMASAYIKIAGHPARTVRGPMTSSGDIAGRPQVVIIGGGFGGLAAAKALARAPVSVT